MEIIKDISAYQNPQPIAISLGMFDGVHRGHQNVINTLNKVAEEKKTASALFSFWPHPRKLINPEFEIQLLNTLEEKISLLEKKSLDFLFLQEFNENFRNLSAEDFIKEILVKKLNVQYIIIGYDHHFGKDRQGNFELLEKMGKELNFEVKQMQSINYQNKNISSTKIRKALQNGDIQTSNEMLNYFYSVSGKVIHGKKIGRTIGYPTANIEVEKGKLLPQKGAYIVEVWLNNQFYKGMLSIGNNPTVGGQNLSVEVYILDFEGDIYGKEITLKFRDFLHPQIKFESLEKLIERLNEDKILTQNYHF